MEKDNKNFNFKWKLIENYFNAFILFVFTLFFVYAFVYNSMLHLVIALVWGIICPFVATFIDKKSHQGKRK